MLKETISDREKFDGHVLLIVCKFMINVFKIINDFYFSDC